jgi:hypothetical protein
MWLVLITGQRDRFVEVDGVEKMISGLSLRQVEIFPDEQSALDFVKSCQLKDIIVSRPQSIGVSSMDGKAA